MLYVVERGDWQSLWNRETRATFNNVASKCGVHLNGGCCYRCCCCSAFQFYLYTSLIGSSAIGGPPCRSLLCIWPLKYSFFVNVWFLSSYRRAEASSWLVGFVVCFMCELWHFLRAGFVRLEAFDSKRYPMLLGSDCLMIDVPVPWVEWLGFTSFRVWKADCVSVRLSPRELLVG